MTWSRLFDRARPLCLCLSLALPVIPLSAASNGLNDTVGEGCGGARALPSCAIENAPARLAAQTVLIPGNPHPYSRLLAPLRFIDSDGIA